MKYIRQEADKLTPTVNYVFFQGKKIKSELAALVEDLPTTFNKLCDSASGLKPAVDFYRDFVNFLMKEYVLFKYS